jgi:hypothetical protein
VFGFETCFKVLAAADRHVQGQVAHIGIYPTVAAADFLSMDAAT